MDDMILELLNAECTLGNQNIIDFIEKFIKNIINLLNSKYTTTITTTQKDHWKELLNKQKNELIDAITKNESITTSLKAMISTKSIIKEVWLDEPITTMKEQFMNSMLELNIKKSALVTLIRTIEHFSYLILSRLQPTLTHDEVSQQLVLLIDKLEKYSITQELLNNFNKSYSWSPGTGVSRKFLKYESYVVIPSTMNVLLSVNNNISSSLNRDSPLLYSVLNKTLFLLIVIS